MEYEPQKFVFLLLNILFEALFLGAFGALICPIIWMLISQRKYLRLAQKILFCISICMFLLASAHIGFLVHQIANAPNLPVFNVRVQILLYATSLALGDCVLIWRVWSIWERNYYIVILPIAMTITSTVIITTQALQYRGGGFFNLNTTPPIAISATNTALCTVLIAGRIWYLRYRMRRLAGPLGMTLGKGLMSGAMFLIETGALFTCTQVLVLIFKPLKNQDAFAMLMNLEMPLIGILPTLLIVLVYFRKLERTIPSTSQDGHRLTQTTMRFEPRAPMNKTFISSSLGSTLFTTVHSDIERDAEAV